jgi:3-oxoacyl-[acyl-carrier-protein] synthase II
MTAPDAVVISGIGAVSAAGWGVEALARALEDGGAGQREVGLLPEVHRAGSSRTAFLVDDIGLRDWLTPMAARRMCRPSRFAVAAAKMATAHAGLEPGSVGPAAVVMTTAYGPAMVTEKIIRQIFLEGPQATSPALFTESVANAPAAQVALALGARGANITITQRQAGPLLALGRGAAEVAAGRAAMALVGAVDEVNPLLHGLLDRFGALARPTSGREERARPFDHRRDGFVVGEGCTMLVLESEQAALARGARILARVIGVGCAFDPTAPPTGWSRDPEVIVQALSRDLDRKGIAPRAVGRIVSGGSGSVSGDRFEGLALRRIWGEEPLPAVLAPKAALGEHGGALLAGGVLAASGASTWPAPGFEVPDPELKIVPGTGGANPEGPVLMNAFAAGGAGSWAVLEPAAA